MVTLLRILAGVLAGLCLALAGAWLAADLYAPTFLAARLTELGLGPVLSVGRVHLPRPEVATAHDIDLRDPKTGEVVAHVDDLEFHYALPGLSGRSFVPKTIVGRGGRVRFSRDAEDLGFVRALAHVIDAVIARARASEAPVGPDGKRAPMAVPSLEFREIDVVLQMPGLPLETVRGCDVRISLEGRDTHVWIEIGASKGVVLLVFGHDGLQQIRCLDVPVTPAFALFLPEGGEMLARELRPSGVLQFDMDREEGGHVRASGQLDQATLTPARAPFPLERASLPFELDGSSFKLKDAKLGFDGGEVTVSVDHAPGQLAITIDAVDARFRADFLDFFPQTQNLSWASCEDGGNIELHLRIEQQQAPAAPLELGSTAGLSVQGWGGVLLHRVKLGPPSRPQVTVEQVVGSFELRDGELVVRETSGLFADGVVRVRGRYDGNTGDLEFNGSVFDADLGRVRSAMTGSDAATHSDLSGWLQGRIVYSGRVGDPSAARGQGQLSVRGGNLWSIKMLNAIVQALSLKRPGSAERHRLEVEFDIEGEQLDVNLLRLDSEFLSLYGQGRIRGMRDLDIDITPLTVPLGPLGELLEYVERQLIKVEVRGTVGEPDVRVIPIKAVTQPVGAFWGWLTGLFSSDAEPAAPTPAPP